MLQIKEISKKYKTGDLVQTALDNVSLNLRDNEFVSILGPSGSGKTTLLNVIGGLDRYDSGDLIINSVSTKKYKDRDWDSYRNHTIGFVFQSYNLIPHQTVLSNVELALTISGISRKERKQKAKDALDKVGLSSQYHKKPNQMSGGQMQRVAIARALVNNPDILLADEPTGALDTETSVQVMELLKEVAKDRLVVMVTHNPELAEKYSTRIVKLSDGKIIDDTNPYEAEAEQKKAEHKNMGKSSMSFFTALSLSFNNLRTKKARTLLTSFAGSIGIIGIALILSLSTGVNAYIKNIQKETMASYPISIESQTMDFSTVMKTGKSETQKKVDHKKDAVYPNNTELKMMSTVTTSFTQNNLTDFKKYLDNKNSKIHDYVGENGIVYSYDTKFSIYTHDPDGVLINTDGSTFDEYKKSDVGSMNAMMEGMSGKSTDNNEELIPGKGKNAVSGAIKDNYNMVYGEWPSEFNEVVLALDQNNEISSKTLFELGILPSKDYKDLMAKIDKGEKVNLKEEKISYKDICNKDFYLLPACDLYNQNENGTFIDLSKNNAETEELIKSAVKMKITGVIRPNEDSKNNLIQSPICYTRLLTDYLIDYTDKSDVVQAQKKSESVNVLNGLSFAPSDDNAKIADAKTYLAGLGVSDKAAMFKNMMQGVYANDEAKLSQIMSLNETQSALMLDNYLKNPEDSVLLSIYNNYISTGDYDDNMSAFGAVSLSAPSAINIYADSFENKDKISDCITDYNKGVKKTDKITYTDYVALLMSSVTTIVNVISYVLIAFVAVSLIVSSIMIGIITYISVLERTKEIGVLRAIGASKHNISEVFNAETFIIGLLSGLIGIGITLLLLIPANAVIHSLADTTEVSAVLPVSSAVILVVLSMLLTLIGGLIPSKKAAKKDPVLALRTE